MYKELPYMKWYHPHELLLVLFLFASRSLFVEKYSILLFQHFPNFVSILLRPSIHDIYIPP